MAQFEPAGAIILGISGDDQAAQAKFAQKYQLSYRLLSDTDHAVAQAYGAWVEKNNYGKKSMGIQRSTFVIDPEGRLAALFPKVSIEGHVQQVLDIVQSLAR